MGVSRCRVSFTDSEGIPHEVEVQAGSLYEADGLTAAPTPMTEFIVAIQLPAIEHRIRLNHVEKEQYARRSGRRYDETAGEGIAGGST